MKTIKNEQQNLNPSLPYPKNPRYLVSTTGIIYDTAKQKEKSFSTTGGYENNRYKRISMKIEGVQKYMYIHRIVAETYLINHFGPNAVINHKNRNTMDNNLNNLEFTTQSRNVADKVLKEIPTSLGTKNVVRIKLLYDNGFSCASIARNLGLIYRSVWNVTSGRSHKDVNYEDYPEHFKVDRIF